jgi:TonB family protein
MAAPRTTPILRVSMEPGAVRLPMVRFRPTAFYPPEMRAARVGGDVLVAFTVDPDGGVTDVEAVKSTRAEFEQAAVDAVKAWEFKPGDNGEAKIGTRMQVRMAFRMENAADDASPPDWKPLDGVVALDPFHVVASVLKAGEALPQPPKTWF